MRVKILEAGTVFADRYEILSALGRGGMGYVYRARHLGLAKHVALKILGTDLTGDYEARFAREARALARLDHPSCVRVLDYGRGNGAQFIAMELIEGDTLAVALREGPMTPARAIAYTRQLLSALVHAHAHGVIHRDIKPENVMLSRGAQRAVLIDFGLASVEGEAALTANGMCVGSPSYIAPERLLGKPHDTRTDLYAIGVVLYEMITGVRPFAAESPEQTMQLALNRPPRPMRALRRDVPLGLEHVITRALAKDPAKRYVDAEEMMLALVDAESFSEEAEAEMNDAADTFAQLFVQEPSLLRRIWTWLRYGNWRWERRLKHDPSSSLSSL